MADITFLVQDANRVAVQLDKESQGRIKTGIYHADINDKAKEDLHESWLMGKVKVVCATIGIHFFFRVLSRGGKTHA